MMQSTQPDAGAAVEAPPPPRYERPTVTTLGRLDELTLGNGENGSDFLGPGSLV